MYNIIVFHSMKLNVPITTAGISNCLCLSLIFNLNGGINLSNFVGIRHLAMCNNLILKYSSA